ncbi:hypothetical protein [Kineococcus radiotolerans]|uniref:hypothetical protein n=1 Tax=Kineococcus radiotolerans TaxID=131568 RepID=UPI00059C6901|nr:hypothetical protein [Kineococcus radiotolerans]
MPQWRSVLQQARLERVAAETALQEAIVAGDLEAADFARIWLADAQASVDELETRYRDQL